MEKEANENEDLRTAALRNAQSIQAARQRADDELRAAKQALETRTRELASSLAIMHATLEAATDGILVTDAKGHVKAFNQHYVDIWRVGTDVLQTRDHRRFAQACGVLLDDPQAYSDALDRIYKDSPPQELEVLKLRDGRIIERHSRLQVVDADTISRVWTFRDITERRRSDEARFRLGAIIESTDDAVVSKTLDGIITTWNESAQRMFGYTAEEVIGKPITILIPEARIHEEATILGRIRRGERIEHFETVRQKKSGEQFHVSLTVSPVKDETGRIIGVSKIARDITQAKSLEEALRDETQVLEVLNKTGTSIASELDLHRLMQSVTDAGRLLGGAQFGAFFYNVQDERGESYLLYTISGAPREAFEKFGLPRNTPVFEATFHGKGVVRSDDITKDPRYGKMEPHHGMPNGHLPVRSYLAVPVSSRSGEVIGGLFFGHPDVGVFTERSERLVVGIAAQAAVAIDNARMYEILKKSAHEREQIIDAERTARSEAERASFLKDEFLATLSHELRTPLNAILGWVQILRTRAGDNADLLHGLDVILRNTKVQTQLIEDLLDMSRIVAGKVRLDVQPVDMQDVMSAAIASVRPSADAKDIRLHVVLDPRGGPVRGDPNRLQQCVWNLLTNAVKFTPKGGKVQVSLQRIASHVEVCVTDDGQGIHPSFLPHIFERFRQADASTTRRHGGLGLGLAIVKQLIELHGGSVRAHSDGEGQGATFCIDLPMMALHEADPQSSRQSPHTRPLDSASMDHPSLAGISVLAVDDESDARNLLKRVLEDCGAEVFVAGSAEEGLKILKQKRPSMIVSDIGMPGQDGYEFIRKVRRLKPEEGGATPAAALTAFARAEDRTKALRAGYQSHVSKPVEPTELTAVVASLAARQR